MSEEEAKTEETKTPKGEEGEAPKEEESTAHFEPVVSRRTAHWTPVVVCTQHSHKYTAWNWLVLAIDHFPCVECSAVSNRKPQITF